MSSWRNRSRRRHAPLLLRAAVLACTLAYMLPSQAQAPLGLETGERVLPVDVTVNGGGGGIWPIVSRDGVLYAPIEAFAAWRLQVRPGTTTIDYRGLRYQPLGGVTGLESRLDAERGVLSLSVPADAFTATRLTRELESVLPRSPVVPAAFLNYDLTYSQVQGPVSTRGLGVLGEVGTSGSWGVLSQTFVAPNVIDGPSRGFVRLDTTFRRDFPDQGYTLMLGDSVLRTGILGRNAYFGGVQFGTNFSLAPYLNRQPVPLIAGETRAPSTVQLYVNDVLRQVSNVPAGPFTLDNLPTLTGTGDVTVRVRDILGRETVITQPFLVRAELLAAGLNDWSVEAGKLRYGLGSDDGDYRGGFVSGMLRRGLSGSTTGEARLEVAQDRSAGGLAVLHGLGSTWFLRGGAMASRDASLGRGARWLVGLERMGFGSTLGLTVEGSTRQFRSLGEDDADVPPRLQAAAQATLDLRSSRIGLAMAYQKPFGSEAVTTYSLSWGTTLRNNWQFSVFFTQAFGPVEGYTVGASLAVPLDPSTFSTSSLQYQNNRAEFYTTVTGTPPGAPGWSWRATAAHQGEARAEAGVNYLSRVGLFSADIAARKSQTDFRVGASGGAIWAQRDVFLVPRFDNAAALVSVPGQPDVGVGLGAQPTQRTNADGVALIGGLQSYQKNPVRLEPNDLPLSAEIDSIEQDVVPPWKSVAKVEFQVRGGKAALLTIVFDDGEPAPVGATLRIEGEEDRSFTVARRGEAYVTGLKAVNRLRLQWRDGQCSFDLPLPPGSPEIARVGPLRCAGVAR